MKKMLFIIFSLFLFLTLESRVFAVSCDECDELTPGTSAHFSCINNCDESGNNESSNSSSKTYKKLQCGDNVVPYVVAQITSKAVLIIQIIVPVIIIIMGMLDLAKAVIAQKEDEIKKGRQVFFRRLIVGLCVFLVFVLVKFVIGLIGSPTMNESAWNCVDCFINGTNCNIIN